MPLRSASIQHLAVVLAVSVVAACGGDDREGAGPADTPNDDPAPSDYTALPSR
ncbi:hypothetical protein [Sorangium sp. So ce1153]|uniref:hypothetical protein n=1 Tax=Sorangium sp. So ce1153 TaxID=3133333 RepID=UPI003F63C926